MALIATFFVIIALISGMYFYGGDILPGASPSDSASKTITGPLDALKSATKYDASNKGYSQMPQGILSMTYLTDLNLSNNNLTGALPAEIRHLSNLEVLDISSNKMTGLPAELGQLSKLRTLNASNNQLTGIPHELGNLQSLELLNLSGNNISEQDLTVIRAKLPASTRIIL